MKRVLTFLALMLLPLSVMAMTPVSDSTLSDVTGQAGVNINADLMMDITIDTIAWGDSDGIAAGQTFGWSSSTHGGYIGVTGFNIQNLRIKARENDTYGSSENYTSSIYGTLASSFSNVYNTAYMKPITIDVATDGGHGAGVTFVRFGLGSLQITMDAMSLAVTLGTDPAVPTNFNQVLGVAHIGAMGVFINPQSYVDIYTAGTCGVNINFHVIVDQLNLDYVAWEDTNGCVNLGTDPQGATVDGTLTWMSTNHAGFVGLDNLRIGAPITVMGTVRIDVNTSLNGEGVYAAHSAAVSVVHIGFLDDFTIDVGRITADVALGAPANLTGPTGVLGNIFIGGLNIAIANGSWVDIWAH